MRTLGNNSKSLLVYDDILTELDERETSSLGGGRGDGQGPPDELSHRLRGEGQEGGGGRTGDGWMGGRGGTTARAASQQAVLRQRGPGRRTAARRSAVGQRPGWVCLPGGGPEGPAVERASERAARGIEEQRWERGRSQSKSSPSIKDEPGEGGQPFGFGGPLFILGGSGRANM